MNGGTRCQIAENSDGWVVLEHLETGAKKRIEEPALLSEIAGRRVELAAWTAPDQDPTLATANAEEAKLIKALPVGLASPAVLRVTLSKLRWIRALQHRGVVEVSDLDYLEGEMLCVAPQVQQEVQFRPSTIQLAWRAMARAGGDPRALVPHYSSRGGPGQLRTCPIGERLLEECLMAAKAEKEGPLRISEIFAAASAAARQWTRDQQAEVATAPSMQTVSRRFHRTFTPYEIAVRNHGKRWADRRYQESTTRIRAEEPLQAAQYDDTDGEVFLVDDQSGLPWGRANLTLGVDESSGEILGVELSERPRSVWSAVSCLLHSVGPKDMTDPMFADCEHPWKAYGVPAECIMDNALYNHADQVEAAVVSIGSIPSWSKPKTPTNKTQIEHLNDDVKRDFTPYLPGWRGSKRDRDGLKDGPSSAVLTTERYRRDFNVWATDRYPFKPREKGLTARERWDAHFRLFKPRLPPNPAALALLCTLREELTFRDTGGLLRLGLRYQSQALADLRKRLGAKVKVTIRIHPYDLSKMYVYDPLAKIFITVPCAERLDYLPGLTNWQQQLIIKMCRERGRKNPSIEDMVWAREKIRILVEQARASTKLLERRRAQRIGNVPSANVNAGKPSEETIVVTALEESVIALDSTVIDFEDEGWAVPASQYQ